MCWCFLWITLLTDYFCFWRVLTMELFMFRDFWHCWLYQLRWHEICCKLLENGNLMSLCFTLFHHLMRLSFIRFGNLMIQSLEILGQELIFGYSFFLFVIGFLFLFSSSPTLLWMFVNVFIFLLSIANWCLAMILYHVPFSTWFNEPRTLFYPLFLFPSFVVKIISTKSL